MDVILRIGAAGRLIDFGIATTRTERSAVMAQRFRVYQRHGYYRPGLKADRDEYDRRAVSFLARVNGGDGRGVIVGSARLILGATRPGFRFPTEKAFRLELPRAVRAIPVSQRIEVGRLVAERPEGIPLSGLLVPLGLIQAISLYARPRGIRCGLAGEAKLPRFRLVHDPPEQLLALEPRHNARTEKPIARANGLSPGFFPPACLCSGT